MTSPHSTNPTSNISPSAVSNNPFILGNIALLAGIPWLLMLSMAGLAVGDPVFPAWFEIFLLGVPAIAFVTWLQWQQPFSPFSLWVISKPPESLSDRDRQVLTLVKQHSNGWYVTGWIATAVAIAISAIFCKMYLAAPLAQTIAPFPAGLRLFGIVWAEIFFLLSNVLLQAGVSALRIKLTADSELNSMKPFAVEKIKNSFTNIGWQSPQLLKFFEEDAIIQNDLPQVESTVQVPDIKESQDVEESGPKNLVSEDEPEEIKVEEVLEPNDLNLSEELEVNDHGQEISSENQEGLETAELEPIEFVENLEVAEFLEPIVIISEPETEQIREIYQTENSLEEIGQELEELEPVEFIEESEVNTFLDIVDTTTEPEIDESAIDQDETVLEIPDISLDEQIVEEVEELEICAIAIEEVVAEEFLFDEVLEPIDQIADLETEKAELEQIIEENQIELILVSEESDEFKFIETVDDSEAENSKAEDSKAEDFSNTTLTIAEKKGLDLFKKSRKTGAPPKKLGFGKTIKRDSNVVLIPETLAPEELELVKSPQQNAIANNEFDKANLDAIATPIEQDLKDPEINTQDFDDELDELIAFNAYVENILREYLEDSEDTEAIAEVDEIAEPTDISEQVLGEKAFTENLPELETKVPEEITEENAPDSNDQEPKDPKYLVQEFLVDKFLARLEELNIADKANKLSIEQAKDNVLELNSEVDEFADLEALLDRKPLSDNPDLGDLGGDRNS